MNIRIKASTILLLFIALTAITTFAQNKTTAKNSVKHKKSLVKKHKKRPDKEEVRTIDIFPPATNDTPNPGYPQLPIDIPDSNSIYDMVDEPAQFPGGISALYEFIGKNLTYPPSAKDADIQGRVIIGFVVEKSGKLSDIKVVRALDPDLDKEALRVVSSMPNWIPAKNKHIVVRSRYYLPIVFKLEEEKKE